GNDGVAVAGEAAGNEIGELSYGTFHSEPVNTGSNLVSAPSGNPGDFSTPTRSLPLAVMILPRRDR
ncbi:MAG: hypothetical protein WBQ66_16390, partial [Blastocatellia bacterium]